jgi:hypothetical protein
MNKIDYLKNSIIAVTAVMAFIIMAVAVFIFTAVPAFASAFEYEYIIKTARASFEEKRLIAETIRVKYPELACDILNIIEAKYPALPAKIPQIVNSCFKNGTKGKLKLIRAAAVEFRSHYDGGISAFIKEFAETVLKANPSLIDDLIAKRDEMKNMAVKHETVIKTFEESKEEIKKIMETRHAAVKDEIKSAASANFNKLNSAGVKKAALELKAFKDANPQIIKRAQELGAKYPQMKKPASLIISLAKEPDALIKLSGIADEELKNDIYAFIDGFLDTLIKEGRADYFGARSEIAALLNKKNPGVLFKAARFKIDARKEMGDYLFKNYPAVPKKIASLLDAHFSGIAGRAIDLINKEQPELIAGVISRLRSEFGGLEADINALLNQKYPGLLNDIESGIQR